MGTDRGVEFSALPGHLASPMCVNIVGLSDFAYSGHEVGKRRELGPLAVGGAYGDVDIDGFGHSTLGDRLPTLRATTHQGCRTALLRSLRVMGRRESPSR